MTETSYVPVAPPSGSLAQSDIKGFGVLADSRIPFVQMKDGKTFYWLPVQHIAQHRPEFDRAAAELIKDPQFQQVLFNQICSDINTRYHCGKKVRQHEYYMPRPGDTVVELGAYLGYYAIWLAEQVGPSGKLLAVEAVPDNYEILRLNLQKNCPDHSIALSKAVSDRQGETTFYRGPGQICSLRQDVVLKFAQKFEKIVVQTDTIDNIIDAHCQGVVDLLIVQLNGSEVIAMNGLTRTISRVRNIVVAAPYNEQNVHHATAIRQYLADNSFELAQVRNTVYGRNMALRD